MERLDTEALDRLCLFGDYVYLVGCRVRDRSRHAGRVVTDGQSLINGLYITAAHRYKILGCVAGCGQTVRIEELKCPGRLAAGDSNLEGSPVSFPFHREDQTGADEAAVALRVVCAKLDRIVDGRGLRRLPLPVVVFAPA